MLYPTWSWTTHGCEISNVPPQTADRIPCIASQWRLGEKHMRKSSICHPTPTANRALPLHQKGRMWDAGCDGLGQTSCRGAITCPATSQKQPTPSLASPPYGSMPGPAQLEVLRLKVVLATEADVRQALRSKGFTRTRVSQLWTECLQSPPRSWAQRELQTAQDQPNCNQSASKELNSTNDAPSIIYPDSIIDAIQEILLRRSYRWSRTKNHTRWINADHDVSPFQNYTKWRIVIMSTISWGIHRFVKDQTMFSWIPVVVCWILPYRGSTKTTTLGRSVRNSLEIHP